MSLGDITTPYKIVYKTNINNADALDKATFSVTNTAVLTAQDINKNSKDTIAAPYDKFIEKERTAYNRETGIITWRVIYNAREASLPAGTSATDVYDSKLDYVLGSMSVVKASNNTPVNFNVENSASEHKLDIVFNEAIDSKLIITYQTKIKIDEINESAMTFNNIFTSKGIEGKATTTINQGNITKDGSITSYNNQIISYTLLVNQNKYTMKDLIITDNYSFLGLETLSEPVLTIGATTLKKDVDYDY